MKGLTASLVHAQAGLLLGLVLVDALPVLSYHTLISAALVAYSFVICFFLSLLMTCIILFSFKAFGLLVYHIPARRILPCSFYFHILLCSH